MTENGIDTNPFPIAALSEEQKATYQEWKELFDICNTPPPEGLEIGAVIMPTGDLMDRAPQSLEVFKKYAAAQSDNPPHLVVTGKWSAGNVETNKSASAEKVVRAMRIRGGLSPELKDRLIAENEAANTKEQAVNVYKLMKDGKIKEPWVIVVSQYHAPRLVSTFVKHLIRQEPELATRIYLAPIDLPWEEQVPLERRGKMGNTRAENVFSEMTRINTYRNNETKDVASKDEMVKYSNWLRSQPVK